MIESLQRDGCVMLPAILTPALSDDLAGALGRLNQAHGLRNLLRTCPAVAALAEELKVVVAPLLGAESRASPGNSPGVRRNTVARRVAVV